MVSPSHVTHLDTTQTNNVGLFESFKHSVQSETVANHFGVDKNVLLDIGVYGAIGFITGYLLKKYSEYCIALVVLLVGIVLLQQFDYISLAVNNTKIHQLLGLQDMPIRADAYGALLWEWAQLHVASSSSLAVGFLVGLKVG